MTSLTSVRILTMDLRKGQVMILTVLIVSGAVLGLTGIAGALMLNQIRQSINIEHSLQAIFAADAGLEWQLYNNFVDSGYPQSEIGRAAFVTQIIPKETEIEVRSVGCAGAEVENPPAGGCPRSINRSLQLFFELVL